MGQVTSLTNVSLDGVMQAFANIAGLLLGRRTYQDFYAVWPARTESPYTAFLNNIPKYVVSRTLKEPLPWRNSVRLDGCDAVNTIAGDLLVMGSGALIHSLAERHLVSKYIVLIHPLVLGTGLRLFAEHGPYVPLRLVDSMTLDSGVVMVTYAPAH